MPRAQDTDRDDWATVKDPKMRKRIQDRLAQRARRKRLALLQEQGNGRLSGRTTRTAADLVTPELQSSSGSSPSPRASGSGDSVYTPPLPLVQTLVDPSTIMQSFLAAMLENGRLLGQACGQCLPTKSKPPTQDLPFSLHPTLLQLSTVHWQWIDRFPMPMFRDIMILHMGQIEEEDFIHDLFNMPTFQVDPGTKSWDPNGWRICEGFAQKWPFLFTAPTANVIELY